MTMADIQMVNSTAFDQAGNTVRQDLNVSVPGWWIQSFIDKFWVYHRKNQHTSASVVLQ